MTRTFLIASVCSLLLLSSACTRDAEPTSGGEAAAGQGTSSLIPADVEKVGEDLTKQAESAAAAAEQEATKAAEQVEQSVAGAASEVEAKTEEIALQAETAVEDASQSITDLTSIVKSSFSVEQLKEAVGTIDSENLKKIATKIGEALQSQNGVVAQLKEQISQIDVSKALESADLKSKLGSATELITQLKGKLTVVVDKLKANGIDVSQFTKLLATE